jgi:hypothetical protein
MFNYKIYHLLIPLTLFGCGQSPISIHGSESNYNSFKKINYNIQYWSNNYNSIKFLIVFDESIDKFKEPWGVHSEYKNGDLFNLTVSGSTGTRQFRESDLKNPSNCILIYVKNGNVFSEEIDSESAKNILKEVRNSIIR